MSKLTYKQRLFVAAYLGESSGNAADAARRAGYRWPEKQGPQQLAKTSVRTAIDASLDEAALKADEILARISDIATADIGDFVSIDGKGGCTLDLAKAKKAGRTHLIKSIKPTKFGLAIELHDTQAALEKLARYRGLFAEREAATKDDLSEAPKRIIIPSADDRHAPDRPSS